MEQEIDLRDIIAIIRKRFVWLVVLPLLAVVISGLVSFLVLTPEYESSTTLLIGRASDQGQLGYQDLQLNRQLVSTYSEIARSRSVAESVIQVLRLDMSTRDLADKISVDGVGSTEIIAIKARDADPQLAQRIAAQVGDSFMEKVIGYSNIDNVMVIDEAIAPENPVSPNKTLRSDEHTSELQSRPHLVCRLLLEKKKKNKITTCT